MLLGHAHIGIRVADLERSVAFYTEKLGFVLDPTKGDAESRIRFVGKGDFFLELVENPGYPGGEDKTQIHIAFYADDFDATIKAMRENGVAFETEEPRTAFGGRIIFFRGPDNERLEMMEV